MNQLKLLLLLTGLLLSVFVPPAHSQPAADGTAPAEPEKPIVATGSTAFCLFELPTSDEGKRRWVNLGIVQYVESNGKELKIFYGGGNFGAGHEARIAYASPAQLEETLNFIRQTAANCR